MKTLAKIAEAAPPTLKLNTDLDSTTGSVEEGNLSPSAMSIRSDTETPHESPPHNSETPKQSECAVSWYICELDIKWNFPVKSGLLPEGDFGEVVSLKWSHIFLFGLQGEVIFLYIQ